MASTWRSSVGISRVLGASCSGNEDPPLKIGKTRSISIGSPMSWPPHMASPRKIPDSAGKGSDDPPWGAEAVSSMGIGSSLGWLSSMVQPLKVLDDAHGGNDDSRGNWFESMAGSIRPKAGNVEQNNRIPLLSKT